MSVVSVREIPDGRGGDSEGITKTRSDRIFRVVCNSTSDNQFTILQAGLLPAQYSFYPGNIFLTCRTMDIRQEKGGFIWIAKAGYSSEPIPQEKIDREQYPNPADRPCRVSARADQYRKIVTYAALVAPEDGVISVDGSDDLADTGVAGDLGALLNSAGDEFDDVTEADDSRQVIILRKNFSEPPTDLFMLENRVNDDVVTIWRNDFPTRTLKCKGTTIGEMQTENGYDYYPWECELTYNQDGWDFEILDKGLYYLDSGTHTRIKDSKGVDVSVSQLLDGSGGILASPTSATAVYRVYRYYKDGDFSQLPLEPQQ
ncbi:MAG TPA: hypothetical protein VGH74_07565 [Planctomycetaceae bacterium]|jgi:hypothetical protein